jgi:hypothetical protein
VRRWNELRDMSQKASLDASDSASIGAKGGKLMHVWKGWAVAVEWDIASKAALSWDEWRAYHQRALSIEQDALAHEPAPQQESVALTERELTRLAFVRWLYQTGRLDPALDDNR